MHTASKNAPQKTITAEFDLITFAVSIEIEGILKIYFILMTHVHFIGCRKIHIFSSTRLSVNRRLLIIAIYTIVKNRKTTTYYYNHAIKNYLLKHVKLLIVMQYNYTKHALLD